MMRRNSALREGSTSDASSSKSLSQTTSLDSQDKSQPNSAAPVYRKPK